MRPNFTIRVYGILIENESLLISDELIKGNYITKLPGGGLEFGEGTIDCVIREFKEELNLEIEVIEHFYTTDFFVASAFDPSYQVMSIYYRVKAKSSIEVPISTKAHDYSQSTNGQAFRWIPLSSLTSKDFTFAIDQKVAEMLNKQIPS